MTENAVIYARYSSHNQREESIADQLRECRDFAESHGYDVLREYSDSAISGKTDDRPSFQRMIRDAQSGTFSAVICYKLDRFARNRYDSAMYKARLKKSGVNVYYARESIPDGPEGIIMEALLEGMAEYYSANLAENVKRGMEGNAIAGKANGVTCYGYRITDDQRYEVDEGQASVVRRIFDEYASGLGETQIASRLNLDGIRTNRDRAWSADGIARTLRNVKYHGVLTFDGKTVEDGIPKIVSDEIWDIVSARVGTRRHYDKAGRVNFLLTGKIFCGECGSPMCGVTGTGMHGDKHAYYSCLGHRKHNCDAKSVRRESIEDSVVMKTVELLSDADNVSKIVDAVMDWQRRMTENDTQLESMTKRLSDVERERSHVVDAIAQVGIDPALRERLESLTAEHVELSERIESAKLDRNVVERGDVERWITSFASGDIEDEGYRRTLIDTFVSRVYVYSDHLTVSYSYAGSPPDRADLQPDKFASSDVWSTKRFECELVRLGAGWLAMDIAR